MISYSNLVAKPEQFRKVCGLTPSEFAYLCDEFDYHWTNYHRYHTLEGRKRSYPASRERSGASLAGSETKLLFLLSYLKTYPPQEYHAFCFGISQAKVSIWVKVLKQILDKSLERLGCMPCQTTGELAKQMRKLGVDTVSMDVTERMVPRATDAEVQKTYYSGKKKTYW